MVEAMAGFGIPQEEMVKLLINPRTGKPISEVTLIKHFRDELDRGMTHANVRVMQGMFKNATTATKVNPGGNPILQIFWAKARMRWRQDDRRPPMGGMGDPDQPQAPLHPDEVNMLEAARRLAFTITMGAKEAAKEADGQGRKPRPAPERSPAKPPPKRAQAGA